MNSRLQYFRDDPKRLLRLFIVIVLLNSISQLYVYLRNEVFVAPIVVGSVPLAGDIEFPLDSNVEITFSHAMDKKTVEESFSVNPEIPYTTSWDGNTFIVDFNDDFKRDQKFIVSISSSARARNFISLEQDYTFDFTTLSNPAISLAAPQGNVQKQVDSIAIIFNKPIIKPSDANFISIEPAVVGERQWVGSTAYLIKPEALKRGESYKITLVDDLKSTDGGLLEKGYSFEFVNFAPTALFAQVAGGENTSNAQINPNGPFTIYFNQPVNQADVRSKLHIYDTRNNVNSILSPENAAEVDFYLVFKNRQKSDDTYAYTQWQKLWEQKVEIYPTKPLDPETAYRLVLDSGFTSQNGTAAAEAGIELGVKTASLPGYVSSNIKFGQQNVGMNNRLGFNFKSPMSRDSIANNIVIEPFDFKTDGSYFISTSYDGREVSVNKFLDRSTNFKVYIPKSTLDAYGRPLGEDVYLEFSTSPYDPSLSIYPSGTYFTNFASNIDTRLITRAVNIDKLEYALYKLDIADYIFLYKNQGNFWTNLNQDSPEIGKYQKVGNWTKDLDLENDIHTDVIVNFNEDFGIDIAPGMYLLDIRAVGKDPKVHDNIVFSIGDVSLTTKTSSSDLLVWATSLSEAEVKRDYDIKVYELEYNKNKSSTMEYIKEHDAVAKQSYKTNDQGVSHNNFTGKDGYYIITAEKDGDFGLVMSNWSSGINPYEFDNVSYDYSQHTNGVPMFKVFAYTDRTLYRPGHAGNYKVLIRDNNLYTYNIPKNAQVRVDIVNLYNAGQLIHSANYDISDAGYVEGAFVVPESASLGTYNLRVTVNGKQYYSTPLLVQEYIRPDFEVTVETPKGPVIRNTGISANTLAKYFYGAPLVSRPVEYRLYKRNFVFRLASEPKYSFYSTREYYGDDNIWRGFEEEEVQTGSSSTDLSGEFSLNTTPVTKEGVSEIYTLEVDVTGTSGRKFTGTNEYVVHMADHYTGIKSDSYLGEAGDISKFNILTVSPNGDKVKNIDVQVNVYHRKYYRVKSKENSGGYYYETSFEDELVDERPVKTDGEGKVRFEYTPETGGMHIFEVVSYDSRGNKSVADTTLYVVSEDPGYWRRENHDRIELVSDKDEYSVGDTATLLPVSTLEDAIGLLSVESERVLDYKTFKINASANSVDLNIKETYVPNVYTSVLLVKPGLDEFNPPEFKLGIKNILVDSTDNLLNVNISTPKPTYSPKESGVATINVKDRNGNSVSNAHVSVALVDDSLNTLSPIKRSNAFTTFYSPRYLSVNTSQSLTASLDRINLNTEIGAKGGSGSKGGAGGEYIDLTRSNFAETALWVGNTTTDASGNASIEFTLPDSITRWNLFALVNDSSGKKFGQGDYNFGSLRDQFISPALPRFLRVADEFSLDVVVHNNLNIAQNLSVGIIADNINIKDDYNKQVLVPANDSKRLSFAANALNEGSANITFTLLKNNEPQDIISQSLEILPFGLEKVQSVSGVATYETIELFNVEPNVNKDHGGLEIKVYGSYLGLVEQSLGRMYSSYYDNTEVISSRLLTQVFKYKLNSLNDSNIGQDILKNQVIGNILRLYNYQLSDGGWGYTDESKKSDIYNSSKALEALIEAKNAGFDVDANRIARGAVFTQSGLNSYTNDLNHQIETFYILELAGYDQTGRIQTAYERRATLTDFSKAYLILAMTQNDGEWARYINQLMSELGEKADLGSARVFWTNPNATWYCGSSQGATSAVLRAFNKVSPNSPLANLAVRHLAQTASSNYISCSERYRTVALMENAIAKNIKSRDTNVSLFVNDNPIASGFLPKDTKDAKFEHFLPISSLIEGTNTTKLVFDKGGASYYSMVLTSLIPFDVVPEDSNGIAISRKVVNIAGNTVEDNTYKVGETYLVKLIVATPNPRWNLLIEDFLPAGFESVNETFTNESNLISENIKDASSDEDPERRNLYSSNVQMKDSVTTMTVSYVPKGLFEYSYAVRAIVPGEFKYRPAQVYEIYSPDIRANTSGDIITVLPLDK